MSSRRCDSLQFKTVSSHQVAALLLPPLLLLCAFSSVKLRKKERKKKKASLMKVDAQPTGRFVTV